MKPIKTIISALIALLFPRRKTELLLRNTPPSTFEQLVRAQMHGPVETLLPYSDKRVQALLWELKYYDSKLAAEILGTILADHLAEILYEALTYKPLVIPVPLHPNRRKARGYNQMERVLLSAAAYSPDTFEYAPSLLVRTRDTPRQTTLSRKERLTNVQGAFAAPQPLSIEGRVCIVIDDVVTTGTTLEAAALPLLQAGASKVILLALTAA